MKRLLLDAIHTARTIEALHPGISGIQMTSTFIDQSITDDDPVLLDAADQSQSSPKKYYGTSFLDNIWYLALPAESLRPGQLTSKVLLNQPLLIGRDNKGKAFAMLDICPHQGIPLSDGSFDGCQVECPFHGWKFDTRGLCTEIPSLTAAQRQRANLRQIKARSFPCDEVQGNIWVYFGDKIDDLPPIPQAPGLEGCQYHKTSTTLIIPTHIDYAVTALIDTAHVPYVHKSWWWRSKKRVYEKAKLYVPSESGWTMVRHRPSQNAWIMRLLGGHIETEISFRLPGCRREYITIGDKTILSGLSACTPIDDHTTQLIHTTYWTFPFLAPLVRPIIDYFVAEFLGQDQAIAIKQQRGLQFNPNLIMTIRDAGTPGAWYFQLKHAWQRATDENQPFVNPIKEKVLRWVT